MTYVYLHTRVVYVGLAQARPNYVGLAQARPNYVGLAQARPNKGTRLTRFLAISVKCSLTELHSKPFAVLFTIDIMAESKCLT